MTPPSIDTDRLRLVLPQAAHLPVYVAYCGSPRSRYVGGPYAPAKAFEKLCAMAGHWHLRGFGRYVVTLKSTGEAIGHVGALQIDDAGPPEMTWTIWADAYEGQGYAAEAVTAYLARNAEDFELDALLVRIDADNARSLRLADRIGAERTLLAQAPPWMPNAITFRLPLGART